MTESLITDDGSNSCSLNENGFSALSLLRFGTINAQEQGVVVWCEDAATHGVSHITGSIMHYDFPDVGPLQTNMVHISVQALLLPVGLLVIDDQEDLGVTGHTCPVRSLG